MTLRLFRFRRFSSQLLLLLAGLFAVVEVSVYLLVSQANERNALVHIEQNLRIGAIIFRQNLTERIDFLAGSAKVMSSDYPIRQLMIQEPIDRRTLRSALLSYRERVDAPVIALFSPEGEMLAQVGGESDAKDTGPFQTLINQATQDDLDQISGYSYLEGKLHVLVVVPLYAPAPNVAAWFGVAYPIAKYAQALKDTTQLDVTFTSDDPAIQPARVLSTTLEEPMARAVAAYIAEPGAQSRPSETVRLDGEDYVTLFQRLDLLDGARVRLALQRSLTAELAPARELERVVLLISLAALVAATLVAFGIARGVSRPVQQLAQHTKLVATGDYSQRIELPREDELGQLATAFNQMTAGLAERDRVRNLLGMVVSPEIANQLLHSDLKLGGEEREVTILFCDLRDFTSFSEKMPPAEVLALLNRYLDRMSTIIEQHGGVIDKYIGDAIMALFGAPVAIPDAAARAITAARAMGDALEELNQELAAEGRPRLAFGIGINTGRVVAGNMGSKTRLNYTVIGDGVNLASRLESQTKEPIHQTLIIISEATARAAGEEKTLRCLGSISVKGKSELVKTYAVDVHPRPWAKRD